MAFEITERAIQELRKLAVGGDRVLRIDVTPGGCAGMTYTATIEDGISEEDEVLFDRDGLRVVAQKVAAGFMDGLTVDYSDDLVAAGFRFTNENASGSCGCGASFSA